MRLKSAQRLCCSQLAILFDRLPQAKRKLRGHSNNFQALENLCQNRIAFIFEHVGSAMDKNIPSPLISILGEIFSEHYTHTDIERLFAYADAPEDTPGGNKVQKTIDWLRLVNKRSPSPLQVLGLLLEDILENPGWDPSISRNWMSVEEPEWSVNLKHRQERIRKALSRSGLSYSVGGHIVTASATPTASLEDMVSQRGLSAVEVEMKRALKQVETDPNAAAQYAGNVLEATFKAYLNKRKIAYDENGDTLNDLWRLTRDDLGINPKNLEAKDLKKIASGLGSIVDGTMYLRNKRSGAHGRSEAEHTASAIRPRHARLVIHAAHTLAAYVLECLEDV